jgi:hypothetical protein
MSLSLKRLYTLNIGDFTITGIRCQFVIDSGFNRQVKKGTFSLYNLSEESYDKIEQDLPVSFSVIDKDGGTPQIFLGLIVNKDQKHGSDGSIIRRIFCWSGGLLFSKKILSITFEKKTTGDQILSRLREEIKPLTIVLSDDAQVKVNDLRYERGITLSGKLQQILREFADDIDEPSSLDENDFLIGIRNVNTHYISSEIGNLIGSPSVNIDKTEIVTDLMPEAKIGDFIDVTSKYFSYASGEAAVVSQMAFIQPLTLSIMAILTVKSGNLKCLYW